MSNFCLSLLAAADSSPLKSVWKFFSDGGVVMILLAICSLVLLAAIFFKVFTLRRELVIPPDLERKVNDFEAHARTLEMEQTLREFEEGCSTLARLCAVAVRHRGETRAEITEAVQTASREEMVHLYSGMTAIDVSAGLAPLLGLLGMAGGLVVMFGGLGENPDTTMISRGISEALNTTVFGLGIAVPAIVAHAVFQRRIDKFSARLENLLAKLARFCEGAPLTASRPSPAKN